MSSLPPLYPESPSFRLTPSQARGSFVLVLDSPHRENEGDLIIAAVHLTPPKLSFMIRHTSGYICAPMPAPRADALGLPLMVPAAHARDPTRTAYTVTVDADLPPAAGFTTGISAADRTATCRLLADKAAAPASFRRPGHVLPLRARAGGVRERRGHTEAAVDLCRLARAGEVGVICEMVGAGAEVEGRPEIEGAGMMRADECLAFGRSWGIPVVTIEDLVRYLEATEGRLEVEARDY